MNGVVESRVLFGLSCCNASHTIVAVFFFSSRRRHTRLQGDWSSDVCSSDLLVKSLLAHGANPNIQLKKPIIGRHQNLVGDGQLTEGATALARASKASDVPVIDRKSVV